MNFAETLDNDLLERAPRNSEQKVPNKVLSVSSMTLKEWAAIHDNPVQRNTVKHAANADHLRVFDDTHRIVHMAVDRRTGRRWKVDAHTRCYLWLRGEVEGLPENLELVVISYQVEGEQGAIELYKRFDSQEAKKTVKDDIFGACRNRGLDFESRFLKDGQFATTLKKLDIHFNGYTSDKIDVNKSVGYWADELLLLDKVNPLRHDFSTGIFMAALLSLGRDAHSALEFWKAYSHDQGLKDGTTVDAVQALRNLNHQIHEEKLTGGGVWADKIMAQALNAYLHYRKGEDFHGRKVKPRALGPGELQKFIDKAKEKKASRQSTLIPAHR